MTSLGKNYYGERAVRFLRVRKSAGFDEVAEWETDVFLESNLGFDAAALGRPSNRERILLPTDDPFGCVEAVVARNEAGKG
ncbi:MAG TPA: hypothetical protein VIT00_12880 [Terrimicrobiaceae bacterium]